MVRRRCAKSTGAAGPVGLSVQRPCGQGLQRRRATAGVEDAPQVLETSNFGVARGTKAGGGGTFRVATETGGPFGRDVF